MLHLQVSIRDCNVIITIKAIASTFDEKVKYWENKMKILEEEIKELSNSIENKTK